MAENNDTETQKDKDAAGTERKEYQNDTGDPTNPQEQQDDADAAPDQTGQPGLPPDEDVKWSPGSDVPAT
jgi:hypothetical protein